MLEEDAAQPLMRNENGESQGLLQDEYTIETQSADDCNDPIHANGDERPNRFVFALTATAALSGLLFGYE